MKAVLHIKFDPTLMFPQDEIDSEYGGDWGKAMEWLWEQEGLGLFDYEDIEFIGILS